MIYEFVSIYDDKLFDSAVLFITGQYEIFNNIVVDRFRDKFGISNKNIGTNLPEVFSTISIDTSDNLSNIETFDNFFYLVNVPAVGGKRVCIVRYNELTKKQLSKIDEYLKNPSKYGVLVVIIDEFVHFRSYLHNKIFISSEKVNLLKLSFPRKSILKDIICNELKNVNITDSALDLFILKLSNQYDMYYEVIELIKSSEERYIDYDTLKRIMGGLANYVIDDFIDRLLSPHRVKMIKARNGKQRESKPRKIYEVYGGLVGSDDHRAVINRIKYKIDDLIEMRILINNGTIPANLKYSITRVKNSLSEGNKLKTLSNYSFLKIQSQASKTSLKDLLFLKMMLNNVRNNQWSNESNERIFFSIINRAILGNDRILNDIGITDNLDIGALKLAHTYHRNTDLMRKEITYNE